MTVKAKWRIFQDVMAYAMRKNDYNTGTQLNLANYRSLFPFIYFDLSYQTEKPTRDPKQLIFRYRLTADAAAQTSTYMQLFSMKKKLKSIRLEMMLVIV